MATIVAIVASFIGPAIELGKCIGAPIKRQCNYLSCFDSNMQSLRDRGRELVDARDGLKMRVDAAKRNAEMIPPEVDAWLTRANQILVDINGVEIDILVVQRGYLNMKSHFFLSKKARKSTDAAKELQEGSKFTIISQPAHPASMVVGSIALKQTYEFKSRKQIEEDIMAALRGNKINIIGICGMGGVGKTTMAKKIMNRVRGEGLFDEVVFVVVSQNVDMLNIQLGIAESLGLRLEEKTLLARANKLRARLTGGTKRILIVLDDVWEMLNLEDLIGIPYESGCTVLLTSRDRNVFKAMNAQKFCALKTLSDREAWSLFREKVGNCVNDLRLVEEVAREFKVCQLPS